MQSLKQITLRDKQRVLNSILINDLCAAIPPSYELLSLRDEELFHKTLSFFSFFSHLSQHYSVQYFEILFFNLTRDQFFVFHFLVILTLNWFSLCVHLFYSFIYFNRNINRVLITKQMSLYFLIFMKTKSKLQTKYFLSELLFNLKLFFYNFLIIY